MGSGAAALSKESEGSEGRMWGCRVCGGRKVAKRSACLAPCPSGGGGQVARRLAPVAAPVAVDERGVVGEGALELRWRCRTCGGRKRAKRLPCSAPCAQDQPPMRATAGVVAGVVPGEETEVEEEEMELEELEGVEEEGEDDEEDMLMTSVSMLD